MRTLLFGILISGSFFSVLMGTLIGFAIIAVCATVVIMARKIRRHRRQRKALEYAQAETAALASAKSKEADQENPSLDAPSVPYMVQQHMPSYAMQEYFLMPAPPVIPQDNN